MKLRSRRGLGWAAFLLFGLALMLLGVLVALSACTPGPCAGGGTRGLLMVALVVLILAACAALVLRREAPAEERP